jgi:hypothetical protein
MCFQEKAMFGVSVFNNPGVQTSGEFLESLKAIEPGCTVAFGAVLVATTSTAAVCNYLRNHDEYLGYLAVMEKFVAEQGGDVEVYTDAYLVATVDEEERKLAESMRGAFEIRMGLQEWGFTNLVPREEAQAQLDLATADETADDLAMLNEFLEADGNDQSLN